MVCQFLLGIMFDFAQILKSGAKVMVISATSKQYVLNYVNFKIIALKIFESLRFYNFFD